jgi:DNA helicase TIP49 (TBP-interacting protein)
MVSERHRQMTAICSKNYYERNRKTCNAVKAEREKRIGAMMQENKKMLESGVNTIKSKDIYYQARGSKHPHSKLTKELVMKIRNDYKKGEVGHGIKALSAKYGVHPGTIQAIVNNVTWRYL